MKILSVKQVLEVTGFCRRTLYRVMDDGKFPRSIQVTSRRVGWVDSEIEEWLQQRIAERDKDAA